MSGIDAIFESIIIDIFFRLIYKYNYIKFEGRIIMKKFLKVFMVVLMVLATMFLLTACGSEEKESKSSSKDGGSDKKEELVFDGDEGKITFQVKEGSGYKISTDSDDFRTSRVQGALVGKDFTINIEFCDDYAYFFDSDFEKLKEARSDYDDFEVVTYNGIDGVQYFSGSYNTYNIMFPVENNEKYYLELSICGTEDTEEAAKKAISNKELLEILDSIEFEAK